MGRYGFDVQYTHSVQSNRTGLDILQVLHLGLINLGVFDTLS